jgi:gliding motility-associated-like protein
MWNVFGPDFLAGAFMYQSLSWEFKYGTAEQKKIFGGALCPGCDLRDSYSGKGDNQQENYDAQQRWMARRLKEHAESFATVFGWRDSGGEVGTRIRMVLAGQLYGTNGHAWNIGPGIEFLQRAYGNGAPRKYLYAVAVAPYFGPGADPSKDTKESFLNMSIDDIERRTLENVDSYFSEFSTQLWTSNPRPIYFGNFLEGLYAKAKMFGLKMFTYEGGNELNTAGVDWKDGERPKWENQYNADAYLSSPRAAAMSKRFLDKWYSWFGYDALFMKNGDYQSIPMGGYSMSHTLNEDLPMRNEYARIANSPAPPLSKERGNVLSGEPMVLLDARKLASYQSDWQNNALGFPVIEYGTHVDANYSLIGENSFDRPFIIRCEKAGKYSFSMERSLVGDLAKEQEWPTYVDIYLNDSLMIKGQSMPVEGPVRKIIYDVDGYERSFAFTKDISLEIPYGVHILRIMPSLPTPGRPGNNGWWNAEGALKNTFELAQYRFKFENAVPPKKPKAILGDVVVCKSNNRAVYEVGELDQGACEYVWSDLPSGASILPLELVPGSNPARYKSGQGTYKIYIDWGSVAAGEYSLKVLAKNVVGASDPLVFKVKVQNCGFEILPSPVCKGELTTFKPEAMTGIVKYIWDNGEIGTPDRFTIKLDASSYGHIYAKPGIYNVSLKTYDAANTEKIYLNTVNVSACGVPVVATPIIYCENQQGILPLTAMISGTGTDLKWYDPSGAALASPPIPDVSAPGEKKYYVTQKNAGIESERAEIVVRVTNAPAKPIVLGENPFSLCQGGNTNQLITQKVSWEAGAQPIWYTTATGGTASNNPTTPTAGQTDFKLYVSAKTLECESGRSLLTISQVRNSPDFQINVENPKECGETGKIYLQGEVTGQSLIEGQKYLVSYSGRDPISLTAVGRPGALASAQIILDNVLPGNYNQFIITNEDGTCPVSKNIPIRVAGQGGANGGEAYAKPARLPSNGVSKIVLLGSDGEILKWQSSVDEGATYQDINETNDTLTTPPLLPGKYLYRAALKKGDCLEPSFSTPATVIVESGDASAGQIKAVPAVVCINTPILLEVENSLGPIQWQMSTDGNNFDNVDRQTYKSYGWKADRTTWFRVAGIKADLSPIYSTVIKIEVSPLTSGGNISASPQTVSQGQTTVVEVNSYTGNVSWKMKSPSGSTFENVPTPSTPNKLTTVPLTEVGTYIFRSVVTSGACPSVPKEVNVVVNGILGPKISPSTQSVCSGGTANLTLRDYSGTVEWQDSIEGRVFTKISGAPDNATFTTPSLTVNTWYRAKVTTSDGEVFSNKVVVTLSPAGIGGNATAGASVVQPGGETMITLSGQTGNVKWQKSSDGVSFDNISPTETGTTLSTGTLATAGEYHYRAEVTNGTCAAVYSTVAKVTVMEPTAAGIASTTTPTVCAGSTASVSLSGHTGTVQWQDSVSNRAFADIDGATRPTYTSEALTTNTWYRAKVTSTTGEVFSNKVAVVVSAAGVGGNAVASAPVVQPGGETTITLSGETGDIKWQKSSDGVSFDNISPTETGTTLSTGTLSTTGEYHYRAEVTNGTCAAVYSTVAKVTVMEPTAAGIASTTTPIICRGGTANLILTGHTGTVQWQDSVANRAFTDIDAATTATFTTEPLTANTWYRAKVTTATGEEFSTMVGVTVNSSGGGTAAAARTTLVTGEEGVLTLSDQIGEIQWESSTDGNTFTDVGSAGTETSYATGTLSIAGTYHYRAKVTSGTCSSAYSNVVHIVVEPATVAGTINTDTPQICPGETAILTSTGHEGEIQWQDSTSGSSKFTDLPNATTTPFTTSAIDEETWYRTKVTGPTGGVAYSAPISITVTRIEQPVISGQPTYCNKGVDKITASPTTADSKFWNLSPTAAGTIDQTGTVTWANTYTGPVVITYTIGGICSTEPKSDSLETETTGSPSVRQIFGDSLACRGREITYQVTPEAGVKYNWEVSINSNKEKDDAKGLGRITYLEEIPKEGAIVTVTPETEMCGTGVSVTKVILKGNDCDLFVPNVITPEATEGLNVWQIEGIQNFPKLSVEIFNRWGDKVYAKTGGYDKPWDGTHQGKPLPTATYYYVIDKQDGSDKITGSITVIRN